MEEEPKITRHYTSTANDQGLTPVSTQNHAYIRKISRPQKLTDQELEELQNSRGYLENGQLKQRLKKSMREQLTTIENIDKQRCKNIKEALKEIDNVIERKYQKNQLKWLKVKSQHDHLRLYLKQKLIEQIQNPDTELHQQVEKSYVLRQNMQNRSNNIFISKDKRVKDFDYDLDSKNVLKINTEQSQIQTLTSRYNNFLSPSSRLITSSSISNRKQSTKNETSYFKPLESSNFTKSRNSQHPQSTMPYLINSKQALLSGATLYKNIEETFDQFVESCKSQFEQDDIDIFVKQTKEKLSKQQQKCGSGYETSRQECSNLKYGQFSKVTAQAIMLDYNEEQDKSKPLHEQIKNQMMKSERVSAQVIRQDLQPTYQYMKNISTQIKRKTLKEYPDTNIHHYIKNTKLKKKCETVLQELWKEQHIQKEEKQNIGQDKAQYKLETEKWNDKNEKYATTAPWDKVLMGQYTQMFKGQVETEQINDYGVKINYQKLNYDQIKNIVARLPSLNNCIDKNEFQKDVDNLDPDSIDGLETEIATDIIKQYRQDQQKIKDSRFNFLKSKSQKTLKVIKQRQQRFENQKQSEQRRREHMKNVKKFRTIVKAIENKNVSLAKNNSDACVKLYEESLKKQKQSKELLLDRKEQFGDPNALKSLYEYFNECESPNKKKRPNSVQTEQRNLKLVQNMTGGPPSDKKEKLAPPGESQINKAALIIQQTFRLYKAQKFFKIKKELQKKEEEAKMKLEAKKKEEQQSKTQKEISFQPRYKRESRDLDSKGEVIYDSSEHLNYRHGSPFLDFSISGSLNPSPEIKKCHFQVKPKKKKKWIDPGLTQQRQKQLNFISAIKNNNMNYLKLYGGFLNKFDLNARDNNKNSALYYAVQNENVEMVNQLIKMGGDPNLQNENNNTCLHLAFKLKNVKIVKILCRKSADLMAMNNQQKTPLNFTDEPFLKQCGLFYYTTILAKQNEDY